MTNSPVPGPGEPVVAVLRTEVLGASFVLRGTIPVPPNTYPRPDGWQPFAVRNPDGVTTPAQAEIVSRYADSSLGADVVEIISRVDPPEDGIVNHPADYEVLLAPHPPIPDPGQPDPTDLLTGPVGLPASVHGLLSKPGQVVLLAEDVFGNTYYTDLVWNTSHVQRLRHGEAMAQIRTHSALVPISPKSGAKGTLPHLLGAHAYLRTFTRAGLVGLDLRLHNGFDGHDKTDPADDAMGLLWFRRVDLLLPAGWEVSIDIADPVFGTGEAFGGYVRWPIVLPQADGKPHVMPQQAQFHRRLMLSSPADTALAEAVLDERGLAFARPVAEGSSDVTKLWSWWNPATARYFPQKHVLPRLENVNPKSIAESQKNLLTAMRRVMETGTDLGGYPVLSGALGWAHPYGVAYGGMTGGLGIHLYDGLRTLVSGSRHGFLHLQLLHRMQTERQPSALFSKSGHPTRIEDWVAFKTSGEAYLPMNFYMGLKAGGGDPFGFEDAPTFQTDFVSANGIWPDYMGDLLSYAPYDLQHLVRYTRAAKALVWIGNDALAKDDLAMQGELARLTYHPLNSSPGGWVSPVSMKAHLIHVQHYPQTGMSFGRQEGWAIDTIAATYAVAPPAWRAQVKPYFDLLLDLLVDAQIPCTGGLSAKTYLKILQGKYQGRISIEQAIYENALWGVAESVYRGADPIRLTMLHDVLRASMLGEISDQAWSSQLHGPWSQTAVAQTPPGSPPFCGQIPADGVSGSIDKYLVWSSYAYGFELTGDIAFLERAQEMIGAPLAAGLQADGLKNLENRAALIALSEFLYP